MTADGGSATLLLPLLPEGPDVSASYAATAAVAAAPRGLADAPPTFEAVAATVRHHGGVRGAADATGSADAAQRMTSLVTATLDQGALRVTCADGLEIVRPAAWMRAAGDGRDPIDVVLRPSRDALTVTWRDGRRTRFSIDTLRG